MDKRDRMWSMTVPSDSMIEAFLAEQGRLDFSYAEVGQSLAGSPAGYNLDHNCVMLGHGEAPFAAARDALRQWRMFPAPWTRIAPAAAPLVRGQVVAMLARAYGLWWLNACRIVYTIDESVPVRRFGFAYGTLPGHVECGEERFSVEWREDDSVWYDVRAFSKPRYWPVRMAKPLARGLQRRFVADSKRAMLRAVAGV